MHVCLFNYLLLNPCKYSHPLRQTHSNQRCILVCGSADHYLCVNANVRLCVCICACSGSLQHRHVLWRLHERGKSVAGSQTRILPELRRKLNESGCKIYSLFDFHLLTPATEFSPRHPRAITGSAQVPLAHACKCTITPAFHFNADVPGRRRFGVGWKLNATSVIIEALVYCFFSFFFFFF